MVIRHDRGSVSSVERTPQGGLRVHAHVTRVGVFEYLRADGSVRREYRPADEVLRDDSIATLEDAPFTVHHPSGLVSPEAYAAHAVGHVRSPRADSDKVAAVVVVNGKAGLDAIHAGLREVSCGYTCDTDETPGVTPEGQSYDAVQRNIRYNHVSLVPRGRAGSEVRLRLDAHNGTTWDLSDSPTQDLMIRIDGKEFPLTSDAERDAAAAAIAKIEAERAAAVKRADDAEKALRERVDVEIARTCERVLGKPGSREDVIKKVLPAVKTDGRSDAEIEVLFDAAIAHHDSASSAAPLRAALASTDVKNDSAPKGKTAAQIREEQLLAQRDAWRKPLNSKE